MKERIFLSFFTVTPKIMHRKITGGRQVAISVGEQ